VKAAILVTARLKSVRLPLKALRPILGRPMLAHQIDRLKLSRAAGQIVICTSWLPEDDPLEELAKREGVGIYRGHPDDVLVRLCNAANQAKLDTIVSCTADNPFVDPEAIDSMLDYHRALRLDYTRMEGLPFGTFAYGLSVAAMERACELKDETDTEVWGGYFTESSRFSCGIWQLEDPTRRWPELRLTVDTPEDFELVRRIFEALYDPGQVFTLSEILSLCRARPELPAINRGVTQKPGRPIRFR
jgi:spore coat polysaccharide biosynthesis protein SpsF